MNQANATNPITLETRSVEQTMNVGRAVGRLCRRGDVIALSGELGAGKTQFVRGLAEQLGADGRAVSSPTFVIMQEYDADQPVLHIDAYRIDSLDEVATLGWTEQLAGDSVSVIEWADRIADELPPNRLAITIEHIDEGHRELTLTGRGDWADRLEMLRPIDRPSDESLSNLRCPVCRKPASVEFSPFCSKQCRMVDLNRWFTGEYRMSREVDWENDDLAQLPRDEGTE